MLLSVFSYAQKEIKVLDHNGNPLAGSHVSYAPLNGGKSYTVITDINGMASVPADFIQNNPVWKLNLDYVGYIGVRDTIETGDNTIYQLQEDNVTLNQVVITGQYAPNSPEKSVHRIKIITREQLDSRGVVNLNDALQFETNIRLAQDNMLGSSASVQGLSGENVKIMIDGVPVIGRQDGNIDLNQINLNNIERIEIVEGPLSVNYGTNALAGTINLISKKESGEKLETSVNSYYESVGQYNLDASVNVSRGNHHAGVSAGRNFFDGWSPGDEFTFLPQSEPADTSRNLQWNPKEQLFAHAQYTYSRKKNSYRIFGDYFNEGIVNRGNPREPYYLSAFDEYFYTRRLMTGLDLAGYLSGNTNWSVLASYSDYNRTRYTYYKDLTSLSEELSSDPDHHDTTGIQTWMSRGALRILPENSVFRWEVGYDLNYETATGKRIENNIQSMGDYALFATGEWSFENGLLIKPGLRYAYNTSYNAPLIPSVNFKYSRKNTSYRLSYAQGFRAPSLKELYFEFVDINHNIYGNQNLKAESSHNFQMGISQRFIRGQQLTTIDGSIFFNSISDMISLAMIQNSQNYTYINIGNYRTMGAEISGNHSINHWKLSAGLVYTGRSDYSDDSITSSDFFFSPEIRTGILYEFKKLGGNVALYYKYNGQLPIYSIDELGSASANVSDAYQMIDVATTKYLFRKKLHCTIGIKNALDVKNISTTGSSGTIHNNAAGSVPVSWGRSFFVTLKFNTSWK